jgi:serine/threonine protein kinase
VTAPPPCYSCDMRWHTCPMSVGRSTESLIGSELAGYRIEALIGRGGMGAVYRAQEAGLERKVALKVIAPELAQDTHFRDRFLRESQIAASLDHPHVIPILKAGEEDGLLFLAMRYVEGTDLARLLAKEGALEPRRAVQLLEQVAEALDAAHELGLVHRDVKPSNVLIASAAGKEHCYLADFGLTKRTASLSGVSAPGQVVGTLEYVAPEQITGDPLDARSDVYSLGCVVYECLTGQAPLPRATDVALLWAHVHEEPLPPSKAKPELPRELDSVLARALAKEPARRYGSHGEDPATPRPGSSSRGRPQAAVRRPRADRSARRRRGRHRLRARPELGRRDRRAELGGRHRPRDESGGGRDPGRCEAGVDRRRRRVGLGGERGREDALANRPAEAQPDTELFPLGDAYRPRLRLRRRLGRVRAARTALPGRPAVWPE